MNEVAKITEEAGRHANDTNWLAVVLLFLTLAGIAWLFRWIVGELKTLFKEANDGRTECARIIATNTTVITECRDTICDATEFMKRKSIILVGVGLLMFSGCVSYVRDEKGERLTGFLQKSTFEGLRVSPKTGLSVKSAETQGDVEMVRAIYEAGKAAAIEAAKTAK